MKLFWEKRIPWFEILLIVAVLAIQFYAAFSDAYNFPNNWFNRDDAYYYFKVAENIGLGHGSTFDGINPTNGYHPLWLLICIPIFLLARFDLILPLRILLIVISLLNIATGILLYRWIGNATSRLTGMLASAFWVFNYHIQTTFYEPGLESAVAFFFIVLLLCLAQRYESKKNDNPARLKEVAWLGAVSALMVFARLDLVFFAIIVGIWIIFRDNPMRYLMPLDILSIAASVFLTFITRLGFPLYYEFSTAALIMLAIGLIVKLPIFYFFGLYQRPATWKPILLLKNIIIAVAAASICSTILIVACSLLHVVPSIPRLVFLIDGALTFCFLILTRAAAYSFRKADPKIQIYTPIEYLRQHWVAWLKAGSLYYGILGGSLGIYMLWNKLAFGTPMPVSGQVKQWWGSFATSIYGSAAKSLLAFLALDHESVFNAWEPLTSWLNGADNLGSFKPFQWIFALDSQVRFMIYAAGLSLIIFLILFLAKKLIAHSIIMSGLIPVTAGSWVQILSYNSTGYAAPKDWYWLTELVFQVMIGSLLIFVIMHLLEKWRFAYIPIWIFIAAFGLRTAVNYYTNTISQMPHGAAPPSTAYMSVLPFLEDHTNPGDMIGMTGGGNVGYFIHDRIIVNMDGLINSYPYFQALKNDEGADYLFKRGMKYIFANEDILTALPYRDQFRGRLQPLTEYGGKDLYQLSEGPTTP